MAQVMQLVDDIDGKPIEQGKGDTATFAVNGATYEIDLNDKNLAKFNETFDFYITHGRRVGGASSPRASRTTSTGGSGAPAKRDPEQLNAIRTWARANGFQVSDRGRIKAEIEEAYNAASK